MTVYQIKTNEYREMEAVAHIFVTLKHVTSQYTVYVSFPVKNETLVIFYHTTPLKKSDYVFCGNSTCGCMPVT